MPTWDLHLLLKSPLFAPLHATIERFKGDSFPTIQTCNAVLAQFFPRITVQQGLHLTFVPQELGKQNFKSQYEPRCYLQGEVQMRDNNWHDLCNSLVWMTFPKIKSAINTRHYQALLDSGKGSVLSQRGALRDTATLIDESGMIVVSSDATLITLLQEFKWQELFWLKREHVLKNMAFYILGHGVYEKALEPYIGLCAHAIVLVVEPIFFTWPLMQQVAAIDQRVADSLIPPENYRASCELSPIPLLGIPGWDSGNSCQSYYDNRHYFRPGRRDRS